jgi:hypothetical protein
MAGITSEDITSFNNKYITPNVTSLNKELMILDTGDNYILAVKGPGYSDALDLYKAMELTINEIPTGHHVNKDTSNFVFDSIGKVIAYGFGDTDASIRIDIPEKLIADIGKSIDFSKVKSFWENIQFPAKPKKHYDANMFSDQLQYHRLIPNTDSLDPEKLHIATPKPNITEYTNKLYIVYNTIYNLALIVNDKHLNCSINKLTDNFPDFVNACEIESGINEDARVSFYGVFHKKSFETIEDIQKKFVSFKDLFNINDKSNKEKELVKNYFLWNYVITNEVDKRMKANDLYKELINHMCIPYDDAAAFKKRLAGYLIELNLQKKRFSDAYYFYGIEKKELPKMTLQEIEEKRIQERKNWTPKYVDDGCADYKTYAEKQQSSLERMCVTGNTVCNPFPRLV